MDYVFNNLKINVTKKKYQFLFACHACKILKVGRKNDFEGTFSGFLIWKPKVSNCLPQYSLNSYLEELLCTK